MARPKQQDNSEIEDVRDGFAALVDELREERKARSQHEEKVVNRLGKFKENPDGSPKRSVFNLRGQRDYPLPRLKARFFCPHPIDQDPEISGATREEIELLNLLEAGEYRFTLTDQSQTTMTISAVKNKATGAVEQMRVETPAFDREMFRQMPPMAKWLREVLAQHPEEIAAQAEAVLSMAQEKKGIANKEIAIAV